VTRLDYKLIEIAEDGFLAAVVLFGLWRGGRLVRAAALMLGAAGAGVVVAWYAGSPLRAWIPGLETALLAGQAPPPALARPGRSRPAGGRGQLRRAGPRSADRPPRFPDRRQHLEHPGAGRRAVGRVGGVAPGSTAHAGLG
jgi:hypothetical protein